MGGIVTQEIVKFTGKFSPLDQWLHCDWFEAIPELVKDYKVEPDKSDTNNRYGDMIAIFGKDI